MTEISEVEAFAISVRDADVEALSPLGERRREFPEVQTGRVSSRYVGSTLKRGIDIVLGSLLATVLLPFCLLIGVLIWLDGDGPVLFRQKRVGRSMTEFRVLKFRTMVPDAEQQLRRWQAEDNDLWRSYLANNFKLRADPRLTRVGRILRRFSLDELPQIVNVLAGEMSLVGPRPLLASELPCYGATISRYCEAKPGVTGLWQIRGRSETRFGARVRFDRLYISNASLKLDLYVLARTLPVVMSRAGAF